MVERLEADLAGKEKSIKHLRDQEKARANEIALAAQACVPSGAIHPSDSNCRQSAAENQLTKTRKELQDQKLELEAVKQQREEQEAKLNETTASMQELSAQLEVHPDVNFTNKTQAKLEVVQQLEAAVETNAECIQTLMDSEKAWMDEIASTNLRHGHSLKRSHAEDELDKAMRACGDFEVALKYAKQEHEQQQRRLSEVSASLEIAAVELESSAMLHHQARKRRGVPSWVAPVSLALGAVAGAVAGSGCKAGGIARAVAGRARFVESKECPDPATP
eukprot:scaffold156689_cov52-Prasinocladus_malaysianus.AAC.3